MAKYFLRCKHISRGKGARATRAAAYRAGERIRDERTSEVYDYSDRRDIAHKEVVLPADLAGRADMAWTQDRAILWNAMEYAGTRRNSRMAREWLVLVPPELTPSQRIHLVQAFATELADKYRCALDVAIHQPRLNADPRNHHAHLLMTTREVSQDGVGDRTTLELGGWERRLRGLAPTRDEYLAIRERWAQLTNQALREAGLEARVDHRSFERQGIDREPTPTIPEKVFYAERTQGHSAAGDAIRARHRERVDARLQGGHRYAQVLEQQKRELKETALEDLKQAEARPKRIRWSGLTRSERNELRRERYLARRTIEKQDPIAEARRREAKRQKYYRERQQNPEALRQQRKQWRAKHANEINRKQREYRRTHADALNSKRRQHRKQRADELNRTKMGQERTATQETGRRPPAPTAEGSAKNWKAYRDSQRSSATADESARNWRAYRETQRQAPTAEESVANWEALRESKKLPEPPQSAPVHTADQGADLATAEGEGTGDNPRRDHDIGL